MFSSTNPIVMISGVLLGLTFISFCGYFAHRLFTHKTQDLLVRFILMVFAILVGVFVVDKVIAFKVNLLSPSQNENLFELIKTLTLMIFSYYFGTQKAQKKSETDELQ